MLKTGDKRKKLEEEKGIVMRFVIGHRFDDILYIDIFSSVHEYLQLVHGVKYVVNFYCCGDS